MPPPAESPIDTQQLMARVRAALGADDATHEEAPAGPVVLAPHFHQEQLLLDQAQRVANVGTVVPPFGGLPRLLRPLARLTTRALYQALQVISVDQRVFNGLLLNVVRMASAGLAHGEAELNGRLGRAEVAVAASERRLGALQAATAAAAQQLGALQAATAASAQQLEGLRAAAAASAQQLGALQAATAQQLAAIEAAAAAAAQRLGAIEAAAGDLRTAVAAREREHVALAERVRTIDDAMGAVAPRIERDHDALIELRQRVAAAQAGVAAQERRLVTLGDDARRALPATPAAAAAAALADEAAHALDALYVDFEERFRGSAGDIRERLRVYLPDVRDVVGTSSGRVLDLGCGRGEWLALLGEEGIGARGIDANRIQVAHCRAAGLDAIEGDVFQHLSAVPDASVDVVTAFHLIEHLDYRLLVELLDHAVRILRPGGLLILETPNPDNVLVGSGEFYLDPTHRHPLPSPLVKFLAEARGLAQVEVRPLHPAPDYLRFDGPTEIAAPLNAYFFGPRDYAVLGRRA